MTNEELDYGELDWLEHDFGLFVDEYEKKTTGDIMTKAEMHVLNFFGFTEGTYPAGSFFRSLIDAIMRADTPNSKKLHSVFPEYVDAVKAYQTGTNMAGDQVDIFADYEGAEVES